MLIQIDLSKELNKELKIYTAVEEMTNMPNAVIKILNENLLKMNKNYKGGTK